MYDLDKMPLEGRLTCMHYHIFIVDGGCAQACVTLTCFTSQFHGLVAFE